MPPSGLFLNFKDPLGKVFMKVNEEGGGITQPVKYFFHTRPISFSRNHNSISDFESVTILDLIKVLDLFTFSSLLPASYVKLSGSLDRYAWAIGRWFTHHKNLFLIVFVKSIK